jgi:hypothetical protein
MVLADEGTRFKPGQSGNHGWLRHDEREALPVTGDKKGPLSITRQRKR